MRLGFIGLGPWGRTLLPLFASHAQIVRCVTKTTRDHASWLDANHPGVEHTVNLAEVFDDPSIGGLVIASSDDTHFDHASRALRAGKHVFVEKPLATDSRHAQQLVDLAVGVGRTLFVDQTWLFDPLFERLVELTATDPVSSLTCTWLKFGSFGSDIAWTLFVHDVAIALSLFRETTVPRAEVATAAAVSDGDSICVGARFSNRRRWLSFVNRLSPQRERFVSVTTESGRVYLWDGYRNSLSTCSNERLTVLETVLPGMALPCAVAAFFKAVEDRVWIPRVTNTALHSVAIVRELLLIGNA